ncbi:acyl-CoA N-acyltransferase [Corynespora cassiicola Philippines]|uniref:Acyl-CoA N-acyltransferase n=1 Tax=Corynespora cassiicola Philippines TaxID=1448308 RepID=A0A2T2NCZ4_CORCC|nr:acyl-CoA N-acyltransferase [Corynespora cassiicola Philippines]
MSTNTAPIITPLVESDFDEWSRVFKESLAHHGDTLPEEQYQKTFTRLVDPKCDAFAMVIRDPVKEDAFLGFAHYFLIPSLKTEKPNMHLSDLYVAESARRQGLGKKLILMVAEEARKRDCYRLQWVTPHDNVARTLYDQVAIGDFVQYRIKLAE